MEQAKLSAQLEDAELDEQSKGHIRYYLNEGRTDEQVVEDIISDMEWWEEDQEDERLRAVLLEHVVQVKLEDMKLN